MQRVAISGSWRTVSAQVETDVRSEVSRIFNAGGGIVSGGALGVDFIATEEALRHDPQASRILLILPTPLPVYASHYRQRATEGVITAAQAESLIAQLSRVKSANPAALEEMNFTVCTPETYYARNPRVIESADSLLAFQVNGSAGTQDAIDKAKQLGKPVCVRRYDI
jgi:hypothetical protein